MRRVTGIFLTLLLAVTLASCGGAEGPGSGTDGDEPTEDQPGGQPEGQPGKLTVDAAGAAWVAYRGGEGAWQVLAAGGADERTVLEPDNPEGRYGVAYVCADEEGEVTVRFTYAVLAERPALTARCGANDDAEVEFYALSGTLSGLSEGEAGFVYGAFSEDRVSADDANYRLAGLGEGEYDLVATAQNAFESGAAAAPPSRMLIRSGVSVEGDRTLDLDLARATPTTSQKVTVEAVPAETQLSGNVSLLTERGTRAELGAFSAEGVQPSLSFDYAALPVETPAGFSYRLLLESFSEDEAGERLSRSLARTFETPDNFTLSLPDPLGAVEVAPEEGRLTTSWRAYGEDADYGLSFEGQGGEEEAETRYLITLDAAWLPDSEEMSHTLPDFSKLEGWDEAWNLSADPFWRLSAHVEREGDVTVSRSSALATEEISED